MGALRFEIPKELGKLLREWLPGFPFRVGLDHVALACDDEAELERVSQPLQSAEIPNTGVKLDETLGKKYVAFKDPDRISWEFHTRGELGIFCQLTSGFLLSISDFPIPMVLSRKKHSTSFQLRLWRRKNLPQRSRGR